MKSIKIILCLTVFLFLSGTFSAARAQTENNKGKVVTIVKVKAPAAATVEFIKQGFVKAIPTYQTIDGLEFKAFSLQKVDGGNAFGGIYFWTNKTSAEKWFSPAWFARVKATYGVDGTVDYYAVISDKSFISEQFDYKIETAATIFVQGLNEKDSKEFTKKSLGLLRSYFVKTADSYAAILLFANEQTANLFVEKKSITKREFFNTPVLLDNVKRSEK